TAPALVHRDLDVLDRVMATPTERHDVDSRLRQVGGRDYDATTRELDLEGDAPGSVEGGHRRLAPVAGGSSPDAAARRARCLGAHAVARVEKDGVVEWK